MPVNNLSVAQVILAEDLLRLGGQKLKQKTHCHLHG